MQKKHKQADEALGHSRGCYSSKIYVSVDALGNPGQVMISISAGQVHDLKKAARLIENEPTGVVVALKAYRYRCSSPKVSGDKKRELQLLSQQVINFFELSQKKKLLEIEKGLLEQKVRQRTEQLEKLNASKDKFFSIIAHDLLNPVNGVVGSANVLANHMEVLTKEEIQKFTQGIFISANRLKRLLTNLLEWASTQTGEMIINPQRVELGKIVKEVVELLKENAQAKDLVVDNLIEENIVLEADENMLHSIIRNLLANAIKFSNKGGSILLTTLISPNHVRLSIADQGVGMSRAIQEKLFRLDVKHSSLGTSEEKGTGLGLLLCKEFAEMHEGWIEVESEPGKGSTFIVGLPKRITRKI